MVIAPQSFASHEPTHHPRHWHRFLRHSLVGSGIESATGVPGFRQRCAAIALEAGGGRRGATGAAGPLAKAARWPDAGRRGLVLSALRRRRHRPGAGHPHRLPEAAAGRGGRPASADGWTSAFPCRPTTGPSSRPPAGTTTRSGPASSRNTTRRTAKRASAAIGTNTTSGPTS